VFEIGCVQLWIGLDCNLNVFNQNDVFNTFVTILLRWGWWQWRWRWQL